MKTVKKLTLLVMPALFILSFCSLPTQAQDSGIAMTAQSLQNAQIVMPQNSTPGQAKFATLLQKRLQQSLGQTVSVVTEDKLSPGKILFHIGPTKACLAAVPEQKDLPAHTYIIRSDGKSNIYFAGPAEFTVGFAVVEFADKVLNIRQYMPAPLGECITKSQSVTVPAEIKAPKPDLTSVYFSGLYQMGNGEVYSTPYLEMQMALQLYKSDEFHHNFHMIFPAEKYAQTHPEYYPEADGKRLIPSSKRWNYGLTSGWQPCLSNPEVVKVTIDYCLNWFKTHPDATSVSIAVNDGGGWCHCANCAAAMKKLGKPDSNLYYDFANTIARALAKEMPGKMVGFIAYGGSASDPPSFPIEKNVLVYKVHPDPNEGLTPWAKLGASTGIYTWLYGTFYVTPRYFPHEFQNFLKKWEQQGAKGLYAETYPNWIVDAPMNYAVAKMARNINVNVDALLEQYSKDMYGPAAADIIEFYQICERAMARRHQHQRNFDDFSQMSSISRPIRYQFMCWRTEDVAQIDKALEKGAAKLTANSIEAQRMNILRDWWSHSRQFILIYKDADKIAEMPLANAQDIEKTGPVVTSLWDNIKQINENSLNKFRDIYLNNKSQAMYYRFQTFPEEFEVSTLINIGPDTWPAITVDAALQKATENLVKKLGRKKTMEIWQDLAAKYPKAQAVFLSQKTLASGEMVNIIDNGSFEKLDPFEKKYRTPLGVMYWNKSGTDIGIDDKVAHSGKRSWYHGVGDGAWISKNISVMPNARYYISVWVRKAKLDNHSRLAILLAEKSSGNKMARNIQYVVPADVPPSTWYKHEIIVTVPDYCDKMSLDLSCKNFSDEGDKVWFDDLEVYRLN